MNKSTFLFLLLCLLPVNVYASGTLTITNNSEQDILCVISRGSTEDSSLEDQGMNFPAGSTSALFAHQDRYIAYVFCPNTTINPPLTSLPLKYGDADISTTLNK